MKNINDSIKKKSRKVIDYYLIKGLSGMALGLFCTLIVGLILQQIGKVIGHNYIGDIVFQLGSIAMICTGVGIGVGVAYSLGAPNLVMFSSAVTGMVGAYASNLVAGKMLVEGKTILATPGDPLGAFIAVVVGIEVGKLISGKTKLDIILTPIVTIFSGGLIGILVGPTVSKGMMSLGQLLVLAVDMQPFIMGIFVSVLMGILLTLPISSAAISIIFSLSGLAAGAATVGCASQMVGFAVASYRENKVNGLVAQGLGTSMLQIPNIIKNPLIWVPPIITSAILGPLATIVFKMENNPVGGGMGTSGLVGQLMTWETMIQSGTPGVLLAKILLLHFVLPAILTLLISELMRKKGWIKKGDMKLNI